MAEFIAESPRLLRLDLRENEIKTGGLMALSLALKVNTSLLRLDLDREPKKETVSMGIKHGEWDREEEVKGRIISETGVAAYPTMTCCTVFVGMYDLNGLFWLRLSDMDKITTN